MDPSLAGMRAVKISRPPTRLACESYLPPRKTEKSGRRRCCNGKEMAQDGKGGRARLGVRRKKDGRPQRKNRRRKKPGKTSGCGSEGRQEADAGATIPANNTISIAGRQGKSGHYWASLSTPKNEGEERGKRGMRNDATTGT